MKRVERQPTEMYTDRQRLVLGALSTAQAMLTTSPKDILPATLVVHIKKQKDMIKSLCIDFSTGDIYIGLVKEQPDTLSGITLEAIESRVMQMKCPPEYRSNRKRDQLLFVNAAITIFQQEARQEMRGSTQSKPRPLPSA